MKSQVGPGKHPGWEASLGLRWVVVSPAMRRDPGEKGCFEGPNMGGFCPAEFEMPVEHLWPCSGTGCRNEARAGGEHLGEAVVWETLGDGWIPE